MARPSADHHYDFRKMKRGQEAKREAERKAKSKTPPKCGIIRGMKGVVSIVAAVLLCPWLAMSDDAVGVTILKAWDMDK